MDEKTGRKAQPEGLYPQSVNGRLPAQGPGYESKEKGREGDQGQGMRYASVQIEKEGGCRGKENVNVRQTGREHAEKGKPGSSWLSWQDLRDKEARYGVGDYIHMFSPGYQTLLSEGGALLGNFPVGGMLGINALQTAAKLCHAPVLHGLEDGRLVQAVEVVVLAGGNARYGVARVGHGVRSSLAVVLPVHPGRISADVLRATGKKAKAGHAQKQGEKDADSPDRALPP